MALRYILIAALSLTTAGCNSFNPFAKTARVSPSNVDMGDYFAERVAVGRIHLEQGRPALAIEAFRQGSYDPRNAGAAYNGMGVAYSMLGREDVARDLFARAVKSDPTDARYARNLARLDGTMLTAQDAQFAAITDQSGEIAPSAQAELPAITAEPASDALAYNSSRPGQPAPREVFITTASDAGDAGFKPAADNVRIRTIAAAGQPASVPAYPVVMELRPSAGLKVPATTTVRAGKYPVKVARAQEYPIRLALEKLPR